MGKSTHYFCDVLHKLGFKPNMRLVTLADIKYLIGRGILFDAGVSIFHVKVAFWRVLSVRYTLEHNRPAWTRFTVSRLSLKDTLFLRGTVHDTVSMMPDKSWQNTFRRSIKLQCGESPDDVLAKLRAKRRRVTPDSPKYGISQHIINVDPTEVNLINDPPQWVVFVWAIPDSLVQSK